MVLRPGTQISVGSKRSVGGNNTDVGGAGIGVGVDVNTCWLQ